MQVDDAQPLTMFSKQSEIAHAGFIDRIQEMSEGGAGSHLREAIRALTGPNQSYGNPGTDVRHSLLPRKALPK